MKIVVFTPHDEHSRRKCHAGFMTSRMRRKLGISSVIATMDPTSAISSIRLIDDLRSLEFIIKALSKKSYF